MDLGEALTFETRRGAEELERTVRAINRLEATTPPAPAHHPLPAATNAANAAAESTAGAAGAAVVLPTLREAAPLPPSRREESQPQPEPQPEPEPPTPPLAGGLPLVGAAGEGGEAARAVMRARLDAAPLVEDMCPAGPHSALTARPSARPPAWACRLARLLHCWLWPCRGTLRPTPAKLAAQEYL